MYASLLAVRDTRHEHIQKVILIEYMAQNGKLKHQSSWCHQGSVSTRLYNIISYPCCVNGIRQEYACEKLVILYEAKCDIPG